MIRRGSWKYIHSPADPDQLYNLADDPDELVNLADDPVQAGHIAAFRAEVAERWNLVAVERDVLASQARRRIVGAANAIGRQPVWDWQPQRDASRDYIRSHMDLELLEAVARFPRVRHD
jgi:choline-sulfatase